MAGLRAVTSQDRNGNHGSDEADVQQHTDEGEEGHPAETAGEETAQ